jgi:hypothetical protein
MVTISIATIYLILTTLTGLVGWILAFYNHSSINDYKKSSDEAIKKLIESQTLDKQRIEAAWTAKYEDLQTLLKDTESVHKVQIGTLIDKHEYDISKLEQDHETELTELSELADNKLKELEKGLQADVELYEKYIENIGNLIKVSKDVIDQVDARGSYRTDDELETFFEALKSIQLELDKFQVETNSNEQP